MLTKTDNFSFGRASGAMPKIKEHASAIHNGVRRILNLRTTQSTILNIEASVRQSSNALTRWNIRRYRVFASQPEIKSPVPKM